MDDNLPPTNDNQQQDNLNINPPEPPTAPPAEPIAPPMPEITETPVVPPTEPTENVTTPEPEIKPEEAKPEEQSIEIGALGNQPSLTSYNQEIVDTNSSKPKKSKKIKTVSSILGILLIIAALPLSMLLVKQRQELRKEAANTDKSGSVSFCGITVSPGSHSYQNGTYTFNYSITGSGHTVEVHEYGCACSDGSRETCGTESGSCETNKYTKSTPINGTITVRGDDCGTFQADVFVLSVDGRPECHNN